MQIGELIGSGRDADVYALPDNWVLRRNRDGRSQAGEAAVMAHLHAHGYPVPEVDPPRAGTPADLVMRRLEGPTLLDAVLAGQMGVAEVGATLAELFVRLHAVPPRDGAEPGAAILHLDLHPLNVIRTAAGPVVIDWSNTREGAPAQDWAMSALVLAQVSQDGSELARHAAELLPVLLSHRPPAIVLDAAVLTWARDQRAADPHHPPGDLDAAVALVIDRAG